MRRRPLALVVVAVVTVVAWASLAEWKIFERLFADPASTDFVVESVRGVLAGTPVSKSWQHRLLAPLAVSLLGGANAAGVDRFLGLTLLVTNVLLFVHAARDGSMRRGLLGVASFGLAHLLLAYKLEYPWDGVDQILFVTFGAWAARATPPTWPRLGAVVLLGLVGAFNHETILYVPLWYLLSSKRRERIGGTIGLASIAAVIAALRAVFYVGRPSLSGQVFEEAAPLIENHVHVMHNLRALFVDDWSAGRAHIALGVLGAIAWLSWLASRSWRAPDAGEADLRRAAVWSLIVIATIVAFGYVNETRHYVLLAAFWVAYVAVKKPSDVHRTEIFAP